MLEKNENGFSSLTLR